MADQDVVATAKVEVVADMSRMMGQFATLPQQIKQSGSLIEKNFVKNFRGITMAASQMSRQITAAMKTITIPALAFAGLSVKKLFGSGTYAGYADKARFDDVRKSIDAGMVRIGHFVMQSQIMGKTMTEWMQKFADILKKVTQEDVQKFVNLLSKALVAMAAMKAMVMGLRFTSTFLRGLEVLSRMSAGSAVASSGGGILGNLLGSFAGSRMGTKGVPTISEIAASMLPPAGQKFTHGAFPGKKFDVMIPSPAIMEAKVEEIIKANARFDKYLIKRLGRKNVEIGEYIRNLPTVYLGKEMIPFQYNMEDGRLKSAQVIKPTQFQPKKYYEAQSKAIKDMEKAVAGYNASAIASSAANTTSTLAKVSASVAMVFAAILPFFIGIIEEANGVRNTADHATEVVKGMITGMKQLFALLELLFVSIAKGFYNLGRTVVAAFKFGKGWWTNMERIWQEAGESFMGDLEKTMKKLFPEDKPKESSDVFNKVAPDYAKKLDAALGSILLPFDDFLAAQGKQRKELEDQLSKTSDPKNVLLIKQKLHKMDEAMEEANTKFERTISDFEKNIGKNLPASMIKAMGLENATPEKMKEIGEGLRKALTDSGWMDKFESIKDLFSRVTKDSADSIKKFGEKVEESWDEITAKLKRKRVLSNFAETLGEIDRKSNADIWELWRNKGEKMGYGGQYMQGTEGVKFAQSVAHDFRSREEAYQNDMRKIELQQVDEATKAVKELEKQNKHWDEFKSLIRDGLTPRNAESLAFAD